MPRSNDTTSFFDGPWLTPLPDRDGVGALTMILVAILAAAFGGLSRFIWQWEKPPRWIKGIGNLMVSVCAGLLVFLPIWETEWGLAHPLTSVVVALAAGWLGGDVINNLASRLLLARGKRNGTDAGNHP